MNTQSVNTSLYQKGDISLERIYGKYRNSFIRYAGKVLSDEFYAEDVVQDVFTGLFQQTNYFVSEMAALKCIYIAIYNRSIDMLRHKQIVQHYETAHSDKQREEVSIGEYNELLTKEFFIIVENGIDTLPPKCKQIFVMKSRKSLSNSEISNLLGLSLRTVENQVYIARNVLQKYIDSYLCS